MPTYPHHHRKAANGIQINHVVLAFWCKMASELHKSAKLQSLKEKCNFGGGEEGGRKRRRRKRRSSRETSF